MPRVQTHNPVAFILKGYPRLSESFIAQEIRALEQRGLDIRIISLRHPTDAHVHPVHREIKAPLLYLPEYLYQEPWRVMKAWWAARRRPAYATARRLWLADLKRDPTPNRIRRFGQALVLARELDADVSHLHAHFLHTPASVARYTSVLTGRDWSFSAHAKDIWTTPAWEKREKLADCAWGVVCTAFARDHLAALCPEGKAGRVHLVYHGLDLERFPPHQISAEDDNHAGLLRFVSVGRLVAKKGYEILLAALAQLPADLDWRLVHIGGGPLARDMSRLADSLGLGLRVSWRGAQPQEEVLAELRRADLFVLASRMAEDGDRDGLPTVLMEAQSQAVPCIASDISGIPELIKDGATGLLVPPGDADALAEAISGLARDPGLRQRLGAAGEARLREHFGLAHNIAALAELFGLNVLDGSS